jgi:diguanylate cyclase (GGDEF)-like protein
VAATPIELTGGDTRTVTVSGGIAALDKQTNFSSEFLVERADRALYRAKAAGRARFEVDSPTDS